MQYTPRAADQLFDSIEAVVEGLKMRLVELSVSQHKGSVLARAIIYKDETVGINDCASVHRAILPRLELAFPKQDIYVEVSSPGIERKIKDGSEFIHYVGKPVTCYRTDISDWTSGILMNAGDTHIVIKGKNGMINLPYSVIAKAKLTSFASAASDAQKEEAAL
ncbi:MAG: ribosome assembly cofactor RimP [Spirochaetaceae bacterium]|jgi:ribosome maturation factor RimP|nr:ribosome assembly cofactor RimP [Spirochaetaceae bacterium]